MNNEKSKTQINLELMYNGLLHKFAYDKFNYKEMQRLFLELGLNPVLFYDLTNIGMVTVIERGLFQLYPIENINFKDVTKRAAEWRSGRDKAKNKPRAIIQDTKRMYKKQVVQASLNIPNHPHDVNGCIAYLKSLGYKIMKPIQQFEEI